MTDQQSNVTLRYSIDEQALANLFSRSDELITNLESISNANDEISRSAQASFSGMADSIGVTNDEIKQLNETFAELNGDFSSNVSAVIPKIDEVNASEVQVSDTLKTQLDYMNQLIEADQARITKAQEWADIIKMNNAYAVGYGNGGDLVGPAEPPTDDGNDSGGGRGGNLSAIGRAFMKGGKEFKSPALSAVGSSLYEAQGASQLMKLTEGIGASVQTVIPALEGLSAGVVGLGAVALVATPLVLIGVAAWNDLNKSLEPLNQSLEDAKTRIDAYYGAIATGTQKSLDAQIVQAQVQQQDDQSKAKALQGTLDNNFAMEKLGVTMTTGSGVAGDFVARLYTGLSGLGAFGGGVKDLQTDLDKTTKSSTDLTGSIQGLSDAATSTQVKLRDQAAADINYINQANALEQERFKLIQQGSTQAVESQMQANLDLQKANEDAVRSLLAKYNNTSDPAQQKTYNDEIQKYLDKNLELTKEYEALDNSVLATVYALEQQRKATDGAIAGIDAENQWEMKKADLIKNSTEQQIRDQEDANRRQVTANKNSIAELEQVLAHTTDDTEITKISAKIADYNKQNANLDIQYTDLVKIIEPLVAANDALKASFKDVGTLFTDAGDAALKAGAVQEKYNDDSAKLDASWKDAQSKADDAFNLKRSQEITTFNEKQSQDDKKNNDKWASETDKVYADYNAAQQKQNETILKYQTDESTKITQINADLANNQAQIASDLAAKIGDIQNKARADELDAASNLDARKIAQLQRKEAQDIASAESAAKKQEDTATKAADKQKAQLEKDTETKIEDLKKSGEAERDQRLAAGLAKIQDEKDQYAVQRQNQIDNFDQKLTDEDGQRQRETDARYDEYIKKKKQLDMQFTDSMSHLHDQFTIQSNAVDTHYKNLSSIQTTGQATIEASWQSMLDTLNKDIPQITSTIPPASFTNTTGFANADLASTVNSQNNYGDFAGYTGDAGMSPDLSYTGQALSQDNRNNNYNNFAGYRPYASGGLTEAGQPFIAGDGGGPELIRMRQPGQVFNAQDTAAMLGRKGSTSIGTLVGKIEINGATMSPEQIGDIVVERIIKEFDNAVNELGG